MNFATHVIDSTQDPVVALTVQQIIAAAGTPTGSAILSAIDTELGSAAWQTGGGGTWGSITGTLANQTDLSNALGGKADSSHTHAIGDVDAEGLQDAIAAMLQAGSHTNLTVTYDDAAGTISLAASGSGGGLDQEQAEDIVANLVDITGGGINVAYDDAAGTLTFSLTGESYTTAEKNKLAAIEANATAGVSATGGSDGMFYSWSSGGGVWAEFPYEVTSDEVVFDKLIQGPIHTLQNLPPLNIGQATIDGLPVWVDVSGNVLPMTGTTGTTDPYASSDCCYSNPILLGLASDGQTPYVAGGYRAGDVMVMLHFDFTDNLSNPPSISTAQGFHFVRSHSNVVDIYARTCTGAEAPATDANYNFTGTKTLILAIRGLNNPYDGSVSGLGPINSVGAGGLSVDAEALPTVNYVQPFPALVFGLLINSDSSNIGADTPPDNWPVLHEWSSAGVGYALYFRDGLHYESENGVGGSIHVVPGWGMSSSAFSEYKVAVTMVMGWDKTNA